MTSLNPLAWFRRRTSRERKASAAASTISAYHVGRPVWTDRNYEQLAEEAYVRNAVAFRCVKMIASGAGAVPWVLSDAKGEQVDEHAILALLNQPAPRVGGPSLFEAFFAYLLLSGNGYLEAVGPKNRSPRELWTLRPDRMKVIPGGQGYPLGYEYEANGRPHRWQMDPTDGSGPILHVKEFHPADDWYGLPRVDPAAYAIDRHNAASAHNKALLDNGARPSGALVFKPFASGDVISTADKETVEATQQHLVDRHGGAENAGRPMTLAGNIDWLEMGVSPRDMDFASGKEDAARDICEAFGVPHILIVPGSSTYNNVREAKLHLWEETILPLHGQLAGSLNTWLAPMFGEGLTLEADLDAIPALEPRREAKRTSTLELYKSNLISLSEARESLQFGEPPDDFVGNVDPAILESLIMSANQTGYEPLVRYMRSVGLVAPGATPESVLQDAMRLIEGDDGNAPSLGEEDDNEE